MYEPEPAQKYKKGYGDHGDAEEMQKFVFRVAMIGRVSSQLLPQGIHGLIVNETQKGVKVKLGDESLFTFRGGNFWRGAFE